MSNWVKLGSVADLTVGFVGNMKKEYLDSGISFFRSLNIKPFYIDTKDLLYISPEFNERIGKSKLREGDIVIVRTGQPGACCVIPKEYDGSNCSDLVIVRPNRKKVNSHFLEAYINFMTQKQINNHQVGAIQKHFNVGSAKEMLLYLPRLDIQERCAEILNALNEKIQNNNKINDELENMAKTLYDYWFLQFEFPNEEGKPYKSSGGKMIWSEELKREIPESWESIQLKEIFRFIKGKIPEKLVDEQENNLSPYITIEVANDMKAQFCSKDNMLYCNGEVIMVMDGAASGDVYIGNYGVLGSTFAMMKRKRQDISDALIYRILNCQSPIYKNANTGSTVPHANRKFIESMKIPIARDMTAYSNVFNEIYTKIIQNRQENKELISLRDFLLPLLMNGQVGFVD